MSPRDFFSSTDFWDKEISSNENGTNQLFDCKFIWDVTYIEMVHGVFNELWLGPVREPQEVDILGEGGILAAQRLEVLLSPGVYQDHTEVVADSSVGKKREIYLIISSLWWFSNTKFDLE